MNGEDNDSLHDDLAAAFEEHSDDEPADPEAEEGTGDEDSGEGSEGVREEGEESAEADGDGGSGEEGGEKAEGDPGEGSTEPEPEPKQPEHKAPASWRPSVREHWAKLPPEVQAEVTRREVEHSETLRQSAEARRAHQEFLETIRPFEGFIAAEGSTPLNAVRSMMQTAAIYRVGSPIQKAQATAEIIKKFGVDINTLDSLLAGEGPPEQVQVQNHVQQAVHQAMAPFQQFIGDIQRQRQQYEEQFQTKAATDVEKFGQTHDFFEDLRDDMADLIEVAARRGREITLEDAYRQAAAMHPEISKILAQREAAQRSKSADNPVNKARKAAASVAGKKTGDVKPRKEAPTLRDEIEAAWDAASE